MSHVVYLHSLLVRKTLLESLLKSPHWSCLVHHSVRLLAIKVREKNREEREEGGGRKRREEEEEGRDDEQEHESVRACAGVMYACTHMRVCAVRECIFLYSPNCKCTSWSTCAQCFVCGWVELNTSVCWYPPKLFLRCCVLQTVENECAHIQLLKDVQLGTYGSIVTGLVFVLLGVIAATPFIPPCFRRFNPPFKPPVTSDATWLTGLPRASAMFDCVC